MRTPRSGFMAVLFDLDGTLVRQEIDFRALKAELALGADGDIIAHMNGLPGPKRLAAVEILKRHEAAAAQRAVFNEGAREALDLAADLGLKTAIVTRNSRASVCTVLGRLGFDVDAVVAREDAAPKPSPEPVLKAAALLGVEPRLTAVVGDFAFDTESAIAAGAVAVFLTNGERPRAPTRAHFTIDTLGELAVILENADAGAVARTEAADVIMP